MGDTWERTIKFVLDYEGRYYENNPMDLGGETKFGISRAGEGRQIWGEVKHGRYMGTHY